MVTPQIIAFLAFFIIVVGFSFVGEGGGESGAEISFSIVNVIKLLGVGIIAAATMVIPGVSGSMIAQFQGNHKSNCKQHHTCQYFHNTDIGKFHHN